MEQSIELLHGVDDADVRGLSALIERVAAHDGHRPIGEHALVELRSGAASSLTAR